MSLRAFATRSPAGDPTHPARGRDLWLLLAGVLCVHLAVVYASRHGLIRDDADSYVVLGRNLAKGYGYVFAPGRLPTAWRAPGYPVLLACVFFLSGGALWPARIVSALLLTGAAYVGYRFAVALLPGMLPASQERERHGIALIAAASIGCYPEFVGLTGLLWSENLFIPLFLSAVWGLYALSKRKTVPLALLSGVLIALCVLTRSTSVILLPVIWFCAFRPAAARLSDSLAPRPNAGRPPWTASLAVGVVATAIALLIVGCWTARNYFVQGRFILVESNVGYNLYVGNRPDTPIPFSWQRATSLKRDVLYEQLTTGRTEGDQSAALTKVALQQIRRDPLRTALLAVGKTVDFWLPDFFIALNLRSGALGPENVWLWRPVLALSALVYLAVAAAAIAGIVRVRRTWEVRFLLLIVVLYTLPHSVVYGLSRYHLPLMPLLIFLAAPVFRSLCLARKSAPSRSSNADDVAA